jgi:hypothetical protein
MNNNFRIFKGIKIIAAIAFFVTAFGFGTMHLWNWLVPALFHGPIISFGQAIGLLVLSKILFGGFLGGWRGRGRCGGNNREHWKQRMQERIAKMTPEEKEKFKNRCGGKYWDFAEQENKPA